MQAILLAAGYGTRLRPYTDIRPKPLFPVVNQPLLHRLLGQLQARDCWPVLVNCHHLAAQIETALAPWPGILIQHEPEILGTGGALRKGLDRLDNDPVLVMNGDLYHDIDPEWVYHRHLLSKNDVTLALHDYPRFNTVGVEGDRVRSFGDGQGEQLAFTGIHVVDPEVIERIPAGRFHHIIDLYRELAAAGKVGYCRVDGRCWRDIGTPADYLDLHRELLAAHEGWVIDPSARLGSGVVLEEWGCIGAGAMIGDGARLCRSVVWDGAEIAAGSRFSDAIVSGDAAIDAAACSAGQP
ncbi:Nucleotidyl transferase [Desulfobulbus propionicus DSM 2032]|jgi:mannose-1-phosphate guanylyltransferase|uniref:Nucleotidyl transferase n=1 Tax=Desulfobulbus propionicus (strain ATCC 33891 / DSM 2032 / VKM B-1956 / 1pr3) TaxID=577650 RepID=A0A7U3YKV1_DESPD|nr:sugar phosphate nucleotidyltransferase [Desulfobulbus propionicus]ADW17200.1 Nucleotidyl transferase [Desulfobulbus propionicus DSM 2032]